MIVITSGLGECLKGTILVGEAIRQQTRNGTVRQVARCDHDR